MNFIMTDTLTAAPVIQPAPLTRQEAFDRIRAGKIHEVLEPARAAQAAFEQGETDDLPVYHAMRVFYFYRPELTQVIVENAETRSSDYLSQLAAGLHYGALVALKRTGRLARDIPQENISGMVGAAEQADIYLTRALHAGAQPSLAYRAPG